MLESETFNRIYDTIKSWDIAVPEAYGGYCGATGNHARAILEALGNTAPPVRVIDGKYQAEVREGRVVIVNRHTGNIVKEGEPLALFRAQDSSALPMIRYYVGLVITAGASEEMTTGAELLRHEFAEFERLYPERMKIPD